MLQIEHLRAGYGGTEILKDLSLSVGSGEIHCIMGPNGSGKSTFAKALIGHPEYQVISGRVLFNGRDLLDMAPEERALEGLFLGYQNPVEVPGVNNAEFMRMAYNSKLVKNGGEEVDPFDFNDILEEKMNWLGLKEGYRDRDVNSGFSGGEKKKNEILQMAVLEPKLAVLDEIDSGLDIDALQLVAESLNKLFSKDNAMIVITHYQRLLDYIKPDFVHVLHDGRIVRSGGPELAKELEENGYDGILQAAAQEQA